MDFDEVLDAIGTMGTGQLEAVRRATLEQYDRLMTRPTEGRMSAAEPPLSRSGPQAAQVARQAAALLPARMPLPEVTTPQGDDPAEDAEMLGDLHLGGTPSGPDVELWDCGRCEGTGWDPKCWDGTAQATCPVCDGSGQVPPPTSFREWLAGMFRGLERGNV